MSPPVSGLARSFTADVTSTGTLPSSLSYAWDFDNNGTTEALTTTGSARHTYSTAGTYTVMVTVTAPDGRTAVNRIAITVS
jgi:PKD repeat protein